MYGSLIESDEDYFAFQLLTAPSQNFNGHLSLQHLALSISLAGQLSSVDGILHQQAQMYRVQSWEYSNATT